MKSILMDVVQKKSVFAKTKEIKIFWTRSLFGFLDSRYASRFKLRATNGLRLPPSK